MSLYQRGKSWYYDFQHHGERYTGSIGNVSKTVAKEEFARKKAEVIEGRLNPNKARKSPTFRQFSEDYLDWARTNKKPTTVLRNQMAINALMPSLGTKNLNAITPWSIEQFKKTRRDAGTQPGTINTELAALKAMLRKAREWGRMTNSPESGVKKLPSPEHRTRFLSEEEEALLLPACPPALRRICQAGILSGLRRIELVSLRPEDVDLERKTLRVESVYSKTGKGRTVPLGPRLQAVLKTALSIRAEAPVVFVTKAGKAWTVDAFTVALQYYSKRVIDPIGPHVLRHTFASRLVMAGVDIRTVQELMGHADITMTMRYAHLSPDHKRGAMEAMESRFPGKSPANFHNTPSERDLGEIEKVISIH